MTAPRDEDGEGPLSFDEPSDAERWARRRDPDLEPADPRTRGADPAPPPRPKASYSWLFGVFVVILLAYISLNTLRNTGAVSRGIEPGKRLPPFAAPLAAGPLDGDANIASGRDQGQRGTRAACSVRGPEILNSCALTRGAPTVLAFVATPEKRCAAQLDVIERVRSRFGGVRFAAIAARTDRAKLRKLIRTRGWTFPVGYDRDGAVFASYGIVDCPTITFAYPGGVAMRTTVKPLSEARLSAVVTRLVAAAERR